MYAALIREGFRFLVMKEDNLGLWEHMDTKLAKDDLLRRMQRVKRRQHATEEVSGKLESTLDLLEEGLVQGTWHQMEIQHQTRLCAVKKVNQRVILQPLVSKENTAYGK
jgi:hypothetical protein